MRIQKKDYSDGFKWKVINEVLSGRFSKEAARKYYGIRSNSAILEWMRKFSGDDNYRAARVWNKPKTTMKKPEDNSKLEKEIKELKNQLKQERLRADIWEKMVDVAEEELGISIRKKFGAERFTNLRQKKGEL